jgi:16S rRNA processing protein RimM
MSDRILLGQFGAAHGIRGEIRVNAYTETPLGIGDYGPFTLDDGRSVEIASLRIQGDNVIARVKGVTDRTAAETLRNRQLFVDRAALPEIEEEDDFYYSDLIGLAVLTEDSAPFGKILSVQNFGAGDLIEIEPTGVERSIYLPFTREIFPSVDIAARTVTVVPPPEIEVRDEDAVAGIEPDETDDAL